MKREKITKTLSLNKVTVTHLGEDEMKKLYGGTMWDTWCIGCTTIHTCDEPTTVYGC